ncbi:hypothetical protein L7F22_058323 [Adiantum nelumboides]|nr:hypothetical protein [Adiantum nelumboides]MCO5604162.1 hypothetical protein [Adiantum nelumboides]
MADSGIVLSNGHKILVLGLGVWRAKPELLHSLILEAICLDFCHFHCAIDYKNEKEVGQALAEFFRQGLVKRRDLFITTKLWNSDHEHVWKACEDNFKNLQLEYLDLYLVHFPVATSSALDGNEVLDIDVTIALKTTWHAMENLISTGLVRSIGISNYDNS